MKHIFVNFKRFDIPKPLGGVNSLAPVDEWARTIIGGVGQGLERYKNEGEEFAMYFPEAHLIHAVTSLEEETLLEKTLSCSLELSAL